MQTVGEQIGLHLGIDSTINAVIQKAINYAHPTYRVIINSRYPYRSILHSEIKRADSLKSGTYSVTGKFFKHFKFTPPFDLKSFNSPISSNAIIMFADLAVEQYLDPTLYECKGRDGKVLLKEFTVYDLKSGILDDRRIVFAKERVRVKGTENKLSKLYDAKIVDDKHILFRFLTEPTFEKPVEVQDPKTLSIDSNKSASKYTIWVQLQDFIPWLDEHELDFQNLTLKKFQEILHIVDVKLFCDCKSFHLIGYNRELSQANSSLFPTSIPHNRWSKIYNKNGWGSFGYGCKHIGNLFRQLSIFESVMLGRLREIKKH